MKIIEPSEALARVAHSGRLDIQGVEAVDLKLAASIAPRGRPSLIDLSGVEFIPSLGMGMLVRVHRSLWSRKARLVLVGARGVV